MLKELLGPSGLVLLGIVIGGAGAFWGAVRQAHLRQRGDENSGSQTELLQDIAARSGNRQALEELVQARARALNENRTDADSNAAAIIKRLPKMTDEFKVLEKNKIDAFEQRLTNFRASWEPLIRAVLERFDSTVAKCQDSGINLKVAKAQQFSWAVDGFSHNQYVVRNVSFGTSAISVTYLPASLMSTQTGPAQVKVQIDGKHCMEWGMYLDSGYCNWNFPDAISGDNRCDLLRGPDGLPSRDEFECVAAAFARLFERFLVIANAHQ